MADLRPGSPRRKGDTDAADRAALDRLSQRIDKARESITDERVLTPSKYEGLTLAWRMVLELVIGLGFGAAIGYAIDEVTGMGPLFLIIFGGLGFAAGVKTMMASATQYQRKAEQQRIAAEQGDDLGKG